MLTTDGLPIAFWISLVLLIVLSGFAWSRRREAWGIPTMAVCGTVVVWYHVDALYNDYGRYGEKFSPELLTSAWWQIIGFTVSLGVAAPLLNDLANPSARSRGSNVVAFLDGRDTLTALQRLLVPAFRIAAVLWITLSVVALLRTGFDWQGLFFPWMGHRAYPWLRDRVGGGVDFVFSLVEYVNIFCLSAFGIIAALALSTRLRLAAISLVFLAWPYVLFDRARNTMLAVVLPAVLCFVFLRLRRRPMVQLCVLLAAFIALEGWFAIVLQKRSIASARADGSYVKSDQSRHLGLNMYEELCWINAFIQDGSYQPNWGRRYLAEAVNPIPRTIWPNKPMIGIDYALARGQGGGAASAAGVHATISTGMIGQGVCNFGSVFGPVAAALLMSGWIAILARFDSTADYVGRLMLYTLGLVLTFNLGRDISLLVAYPLIFGYFIVRFAENRKRNGPRPAIVQDYASRAA